MRIESFACQDKACLYLFEPITAVGPPCKAGWVIPLR